MSRKQSFLFKWRTTVFISIIIGMLLLTNISVYASTNTAAPVANTLNVRDFGARGDGITDDSRAFQSAIDEASARGLMLVIPPSANNYLIRTTLHLRSNLHLSGYGATLFMPSNAVRTNMFVSRGSAFISNVTIEGLTLKSINNIPDGSSASLTSNVQGIYIMGVDNLRMRDLTMDDMVVGLKFGWANNGLVNRNITLDNLDISDSGIALLIHSTDNLTMRNSRLCGRNGDSTRDHALYISGDTSNFLFENVKFENSNGGGIHLYNDYPDKAPPTNMTFRNSTVNNVWAAAYVYSGARNVTFDGMQLSNYVRGFEIKYTYNLNISNVNISQQRPQATELNAFGFEIHDMQNSRISNITIDGARKVGPIFVFGGNVNGLEISSVNAFNLNNNHFVLSNRDSLIRSMLVTNNRVTWLNTTTNRIGLRGVGSDAIFRSNAFINLGPQISSLIQNSAGTNVLVENNTFFGISRLTSSRDTSISRNNTRLTTLN